jgi:hypothetical protein
MKILSRFKDYYDYLAHQYGIDEKVIFKRDSFSETKFNFDLKVPNVRAFITAEVSIAYLVVNGLGYIIYTKRYGTATKLYFYGDDIELDKKLKQYNKPWLTQPKYVAFNIPNVEELIRMVGSPTFIITEFDTYELGTVRIAKQAPNLGALGFAKYKDAYIMYQETACYIGKIFGSVEPPIQISDKDRIVAHGFDLKTSFRGKQ